MSVDVLTSFFGWMSVLNIGLLAFSMIVTLLLRNVTARFHSRMFGIEEADVHKAIYYYMAHYKILTIVFCIVPWLALKLI